MAYSVRLPGTTIPKGSLCLLAEAAQDLLTGIPVLTASPPFRPPRAGSWLESGTEPLFQVQSVLGWPFPSGAVPAALLRAEQDIPPGEPMLLDTRSHGRTLAWITLSDKGHAGLREDRSGPLIEEMARANYSLDLVRGYVLPDEIGPLKALITDLSLLQRFDFVLTTGGTGLTPRDITPEATLAVIEKRLPGFERAMTAASLAKTPHGAISRAVAGTLGTAIVVNLPGSPKAVRENLEAILPALGHASDKLRGDSGECAMI